MLKAILSLAFLFSFSAFAAKTVTTTKTVKTEKTVKTTASVAKTESGATEVNTNMGWPTAKSELKESAEEVKAKWNGFTPEKRDDAPARKTASSKEIKTKVKSKSTTKN